MQPCEVCSMKVQKRMLMAKRNIIERYDGKIKSVMKNRYIYSSYKNFVHEYLFDIITYLKNNTNVIRRTKVT